MRSFLEGYSVSEDFLPDVEQQVQTQRCDCARGPQDKSEGSRSVYAASAHAQHGIDRESNPTDLLSLRACRLSTSLTIAREKFFKIVS